MVETLRPMRVGELLDRSFRVTPDVVRELWFLFLVVASTGAVADTFETSFRAGTWGTKGLYFALRTMEALLAFYLHIVAVYVADDLWHGRTPNGKAARDRASIKMCFRIGGQWLLLTIGTTFFSFFFLLPGIIYFLNRFVAAYVILLEDSGVFAGMRRSKYLMKFAPAARFGSFTSPKARLTGVMIVTFLISVVPAIVLGGIAGFGSFIDTAARLVIFFAGCLLTVICNAYANVTYLGFYYDLRLRAEGDDLFDELRVLSARIA